MLTHDEPHKDNGDGCRPKDDTTPPLRPQPEHGYESITRQIDGDEGVDSTIINVHQPCKPQV